ncbi:hypothetical protein B9Z19DRAFT_1073989 [Tuber borchii]|uniref:Secreted protein n=1 Tax=Tuber borchii TaxID=42251 RepID=A0A2T7A4Y2_TUBBO|nr:hypothetical protein B9Z19DRAFT_1073989 [Tuber borchii]
MKKVLSSMILCCPVAMLSPYSSPVKIQDSTSTVQCSMARSESSCIVNGCFSPFFPSFPTSFLACQYADVGLFLQQTFCLKCSNTDTVLSFGMPMYSRAALTRSYR